MRAVLTAAETQALDRATEARGVSIPGLMERAGHGCARAAAEVAGGAYGKRLVAVCGKGNNGGDAIVAARVAAGWGMAASAVLLAPIEDLAEPARTMAGGLARAGVRVLPFEPSRVRRELARADVAIDGLFGSGFRGTPEGDYRVAIEALNEGPPVVAVDIPSGVDGDTGAAPGPAVRAAVTVAFGAPKAGDVLFPGAAHAGRLEVVDIGFPPDLVTSDLLLAEPADVAAMLPRRAADDHKHRSGDVLVVGSSRRMTGAVRLMAAGAARAGAGLVTVAVPESILPIVQGATPEWVYLPLPERDGAVAEEGWRVIDERVERFDAIAVGPGLGTDAEAPAFVRRLVRSSPVPVVGDADGLNAFRGHVADIRGRSADLVLTPHAGEFARLFEVPPAEVATDRVGFTRKAAADTGAIVVLKGPGTLIGDPEGRVVINPTGSSALATGGTGDVLAGVIATYLARGLGPADAAVAAAFVHGLAGQAAGRWTGEGTTAPDVADALPAVVQALVGEHA